MKFIAKTIVFCLPVIVFALPVVVPTLSTSASPTTALISSTSTIAPTATFISALTSGSTPVSSVVPISSSASATPSDSASLSSSNITAAQLLQIAPSAGACDPSGQFPDECRTADQAVPFINDAFNQFNLAQPGVQAALVSLMAFETSDFQFDKNHQFPPPGRPGQGTRYLMEFPSVYKYALDTPSVAAMAQALAPDPTTASTDVQNQVLALVLPDNLSFASAMWFLAQSGSCDASIITGLEEGTEQGWEDYITNCVGTTVTADRKAVYDKAVIALGVQQGGS